MKWPLRFRTLSFAITIGVVMVESALWAIPVGFALWLGGLGSVAGIALTLVYISIAISVAVAAYAHLWRPALSAQTRRITA